MLYRWHTVQPEREIHRTPEPIVYNDDDILWQKWQNERHREKLHRFIAHLKAQRFRPDYTAKELVDKYRNMYGEPHREDGMVDLFVKTATWRELFGCSYGFDGWQDKATTNDALVDCKGRPFNMFDNMHHGDYAAGVGGRDPANNWGLIQQTSKTDSSVVVREVWVCCGLPREHPGCWIHNEKYKIEPYRAINSFGLWRYVTENNWDWIKDNMWNCQTTKGTMWRDESKYNALDNEIRTIKENRELVDEYIRVLRESYEEKANEDDPLNIALDPFSKLSPVAKQQLEKLCALQNEYNAIQCGAHKLTPNDIFALDDGVVWMNNPDNLNVVDGISLLKQRQKTIEEYRKDAERYTAASKNINLAPYNRICSILDTLIFLNWDLKQETEILKLYQKFGDEDFLDKYIKNSVNLFVGILKEKEKVLEEILELCNKYVVDFNNFVRSKSINYPSLKELESKKNEFNDITTKIRYQGNTGFDVITEFRSIVITLDDYKSRKQEYETNALLTLEQQKPRNISELMKLDQGLQNEMAVFEREKNSLKSELALFGKTKDFYNRNFKYLDKNIELPVKENELNTKVKALGGIFTPESIARGTRKLEIAKANFDIGSNIVQEELKNPLTENGLFVAVQWNALKPYFNIYKNDVLNAARDLVEKLCLLTKMDTRQETEIATKIDFLVLELDVKTYVDQNSNRLITDAEYDAIHNETKVPKVQLKNVQKSLLLKRIALDKIDTSARADANIKKAKEKYLNDIKSAVDPAYERSIWEQVKSIYETPELYQNFVDQLPKDKQYLFLVNHKRSQFGEDLKQAHKQFIYNKLIDMNVSFDDLIGKHAIFVGKVEAETKDILAWVNIGKTTLDSKEFDVFAIASEDELQKINSLVAKFLDKSYFTLPKRFTTQNTLPDLIKDVTELGIYFKTLTNRDYILLLSVLLDFVAGKKSLNEFKSALDLEKSFFSENPRPVSVTTKVDTNKRIDVKKRLSELPPHTNPYNLITKNELLYSNQSCWIDTSFTCLFSIPGNSLTIDILNKDAIFFESVYAIKFSDGNEITKQKCSPEKIQELHDTIVDDIIYINSQNKPPNQCKSRKWWVYSFGCFTAQYSARYATSEEEPDIVFEGLKILYGLEQNKILKYNETMSKPNPTQDSEFRISVQKMDSEKNIGEYNNWKTNNLAGIIVLKDRHYRSYIHDFKNDTWTYIDNKGYLEPGEAVAKTTTRFDNISNYDLELDMQLENYVPMYFIYYSADELKMVLNQKIFAKDKSNELEKLQAEFEKLRLDPDTTILQLEEFNKKIPAKYDVLSQQVLDIININKCLANSNLGSYGWIYTDQTSIWKLSFESSSDIDLLNATIDVYNERDEIISKCLERYDWVLMEWAGKHNEIEALKQAKLKEFEPALLREFNLQRLDPKTECNVFDALLDKTRHLPDLNKKVLEFQDVCKKLKTPYGQLIVMLMEYQNKYDAAINKKSLKQIYENFTKDKTAVFDPEEAIIKNYDWLLQEWKNLLEQTNQKQLRKEEEFGRTSPEVRIKRERKEYGLFEAYLPMPPQTTFEERVEQAISQEQNAEIREQYEATALFFEEPVVKAEGERGLFEAYSPTPPQTTLETKVEQAISQEQNPEIKEQYETTASFFEEAVVKAEGERGLFEAYPPTPPQTTFEERVEQAISEEQNPEIKEQYETTALYL